MTTNDTPSWRHTALIIPLYTGKSCYDHIGNRRFRVTIAVNLRRYVYARTKVEKSQVVASIVEHLRESSSVGGFVKKNHRTGRYMAVSDALAREKVGHALRDALNVMKRAQRDSPFKIACLDKRETLFEAQEAIFKSLDLCRRHDESNEEDTPDTCVSSAPNLNASFNVCEQEQDSNATFVMSV